MIRVLTGATLIDGTGAAPVPDAAVVIDGDRIAAAGPARGAVLARATPRSSTRAGRTIIPGLIDAHDHLASHGYGLATRWGLDEPASTAHLRTARVLAETLAMGYTTVRDGGGLDAGFKLAIEQGLIAGPRLVLARADHLADRRHRRSRQPLGPRLLRRLRSPAAGQRGQRARCGARRGPHHGPRRRRRDQDRDHRRRQLARRATAPSTRPSRSARWRRWWRSRTRSGGA